MKVMKNSHSFKLILQFLIVCWPTLHFGQDLKSFVQEIDFSKDTLEDVFQHVAKSMDYDLRMLSKIPEYTSRSQILSHALDRRKGICEHYSELLHQTLSSLGYESYIVSGYTRMEGRLNTEFGHTWNAVKWNGEWYLFDPTYASGYVQNNRFYKEYDNNWFMVSPQKMIQTHYPFDPVWQLLDHPFNHHDILKSDLSQPKKGSYMDYNAIIEEERMLSEAAVAERAIARIKQAGVTNQLTQYRISYLNTIIQNQKAKSDIGNINAGVDMVNEAATLFNQYQNAKVNNFKSPDWTKEKIQSSLMDIQEKLETASTIFETAKITDPAAQKDFRDLKRNTASMLQAVKKELRSL